MKKFSWPNLEEFRTFYTARSDYAHEREEADQKNKISLMLVPETLNKACKAVSEITELAPSRVHDHFKFKPRELLEIFEKMTHRNRGELIDLVASEPGKYEGAGKAAKLAGAACAITAGAGIGLVGAVNILFNPVVGVPMTLAGSVIACSGAGLMDWDKKSSSDQSLRDDLQNLKRLAAPKPAAA